MPAVGPLLAPARADERHFTYSYEPKVLPRGGIEFEQWATLRSGKGEGIQSAWDLRSELEYGLTDRLTTALYLNFQSLHADLPGEASDRNDFTFEGLSSEWKLKLADPTADPVGLLLYAEATSDLGSKLELEQKIVLGKDLDRVVLALNAIAEEEWEFEEQGTGKELALELTAGAAYRFTDRFSAGVEVRQKNVFPDMEDLEHSALFAGPVIHYASERWWATLTVLPQALAFRNRTSGSLDLDEFERVEARFLVGIHF